jgi:hypothetical protein
MEQVYQSVKATGSAEETIRQRWFLDTVLLVYIYNQRNLFTTFILKESGLKTGDSITVVKGIGSTIMIGVGPNGSTRLIQLSNVLYSLYFHANLMSYVGLKKKGLK